MANIPYHIRRAIQIVKALKDVNFDSPDSLIERACELAQISRKEVFSKKRTKHIVPREDRFYRPRQAIQYLLQENQSLGISDIGRISGGRDHITARHAIRGMETLLQLYGSEIPVLESDLKTPKRFKFDPMVITGTCDPESRTYIWHIRPTTYLEGEEWKNRNS